MFTEKIGQKWSKKKKIPVVRTVCTSHKTGNRCSCERHGEIFHITLSPTQTHLSPSPHDSARQLATVSFSTITHQGNDANHSHTQVLGSCLLRTLVVNSPPDVSGSWVLECTPVMFICLMLLWHIAVKRSLLRRVVARGWPADPCLCMLPIPSLLLHRTAVAVKQGNVSQSHQPSSDMGVFQKRIVADIRDRGSRQTLLGP